MKFTIDVKPTVQIPVKKVECDDGVVFEEQKEIKLFEIRISDESGKIGITAIRRDENIRLGIATGLCLFMESRDGTGSLIDSDLHQEAQEFDRHRQ